MAAPGTGFGPRFALIGLRVSLALASLAALLAGLLLDGAELARLAATHLSPDGELSAETARAVASLRPIILAIGAILLVAAIAVRPLMSAYLGLEGHLITGLSLLVRGLGAAGRRIGTDLAGFPRSVPERAREPFLLAVLLALVVVLSIFGHSAQPPFHAEGINLQPPKNLILHGKYATHSNDRYDDETYRISTGPAMLLPTALAFALFGVSFATADGLAILVFLAFLVVTYLALRGHYGGGAVLLGLFFFVLNPANIFFGPSNGYIGGGMGESPALLYLIAGVLVWRSAIDRASHLRLLVAGILFGLSFQSKWLFLFALPAVVATWGLLALSGRRLPSRVYILPAIGLLIPPAAFFIMRVSQLGLTAEFAHLSRIWGQHGGRAVGFSAGEGQVRSIFAVTRPLITLAQVDFWSVLGVFVTVPALIYAAVDLRRRLDPAPLFIITFTGIWLVWWVLFSYDLPLQHLLYVMPFVQIYVAKLLVDGWRASRATGAAPLRACLLVAMALVVFGKTVLPFFHDIDDIYQGRQTLKPAYEEMVDYVNRHLEPDAIVSGWNWSQPWWLSVEVDRAVRNRAIYAPEERDSRPEYLLITPEWPLENPGTGWPNMAYASHWTLRQNERRKQFIESECTHLLTTGTEHQWSIYRVNPRPRGAP